MVADTQGFPASGIPILKDQLGNIVFGAPWDKVQALLANGSLTSPAFAFNAERNTGFRYHGPNDFRAVNNGSDIAAFVNGGVYAGTFVIDIANGDVKLVRDAANTLAQRNSTTAQTYNIYNTFTNTSNYERGYLKWSSNVLQIGAEALGTGVARNVTISSIVNARKTADQSLTLTNTLTNDSHLSFSIGASEEWIADFNLDAGAALATTGIQVAVNAPSGATINVSTALIPDFLTAANSSMKRTTTVGGAMDFTALGQVGTSDAQLQLTVWVLNSTTAGTVQLQFAQSTSSASALTLRKGSFMRANRVA